MAVPAVPPYHLSGRPAQQAVDLPDVLVLSDPHQPVQQAVDLPDVLVLSGPADPHQPAQRRIQGHQQLNTLSGTSGVTQKEVGQMRKYCIDIFVSMCSAQTQTRMGCLRKSPEVKPIPTVD